MRTIERTRQFKHIEMCSEYPMANALNELVEPQPPRFASLLPFLMQWRDEVYGERTE